MDNPITTSLPADLPTNWTQYQVVSPNGTEAGLDEQHGYNYLMTQVNNAQNAAKECGEALGDMTGADIPVSGSDSTRISTALSNKVTGGFTIYRDPGLDLDMDLSTITMDTLFATMPSNTIMVAGLDSGWNKDIAPAATGTLIAVSRYQGRKFAIFNTAGLSDLWIGSMGSSFSGWKPFAMAEPPQEYTLPLTDYVTELYGCRYGRDQFGQVVCYGTMTPTREISTGITIATLPAGYRPTNTLRVAGIVVDQSGFASAIGIGIATTGEVSVRGDTVPSTAQYVSFLVAFQGA